MYHSLTQSIIRQDLAYWMLYACLRPDRNPRLLSYPYYAKYAIPGDRTYFRHIDMNVPQYLRTGHGINIIQGGVSLDDATRSKITIQKSSLASITRSKIGRNYARVAAPCQTKRSTESSTSGSQAMRSALDTSPLFPADEGTRESHAQKSFTAPPALVAHA